MRDTWPLARRVLPAIAVTATLLAIGVPPPPPGAVDLGHWSVLAGALIGLAMFAALARRRPRLPPLAAARRSALCVAAAYLTLRSAYEELVWRALVLGLLLHVAPAAAALGLSLAPWVLSHRRQGRLAFGHVATGTAFGGLYWAAGTLAAPIAAHSSYNLAVCFGRAWARGDPPP